MISSFVHLCYLKANKMKERTNGARIFSWYAIMNNMSILYLRIRYEGRLIINRLLLITNISHACLLTYILH